MKLSKIYTNNQKSFKTIEFEDGMNFVLAEDHSVGKSTLFKLIDYCLFKSKPEFLKLPIFNDLEFYLELKINDQFYITIKRPVSGRAKDCIKVATEKKYYTDLPVDEFDFTGGVEKALKFLEEKSSFLLGEIRPYITYFLRDQDNQSDVFRLNKFERSKDIDYKPVVASLLGIDGEKIRSKYALEELINNDSYNMQVLEQKLGYCKTKEAVLEEIAVYKSQLQSKEEKYDQFDFYLSEHNISQELVNTIERNISILNVQRNSLKREINYIDNALKTSMSISMEDIKGLFDEIKVLFPDDLKRNYEGVVEFNHQVTKERELIFKENRKIFVERTESINKELSELNFQRKNMLGVLRETDSMVKFKKLEEEIIEIKATVKLHESKLQIFSEIDRLKVSKKENSGRLEDLIKNQDDLTKTKFIEDLKVAVKMFGKIVFDRDLAFSVGFNTSNNLDFHLKIASQKGFDNFEDDGNTVKKLLCFVFSASLAYTNNNERFFQFVAFDSPFDGDKNFWQNGVYNALKELARVGIQTLITTITDEIKNVDNLAEVRSKYMRRLLTEKDKLIGDF